MQIIEVTKAEISTVRTLAYKIWPHAYEAILSKEQLAYMLDNFYSIASLEAQMDKGHVFLLIQEDGINLGFASYQINTLPNKTKLHKIYIDPDTQGKGVGKFLLNEVVQRALNSGNSHLFLNVNKYNKAFHFYEKLGFQKIADEVIEIGNGYVMDDYVMELAFD